MTPSHRPRPGSQEHPGGRRPRGTVAFPTTSPVFGRVSPPDSGIEDTIRQEVLNLFAEPAPGPGTPPPAVRSAPPRRGRHRAERGRLPRVLMGVAGVAAVGIGSLAALHTLSGASGCERTTADRGRAATVDGATAAGGTTTAPPAPPSPAVSPPATPPAAPSGAPPRTSAPPAPSREAVAPPVRTPRPAAPDGAGSTPPAAPDREPSPPSPQPPRWPDLAVLTLGSSGPEVAELQQRLAQLHVYRGPYDGIFSHEVALGVHRYQWVRNIDEPAGVYGPATRAALRAETIAPERSGF